MTEAEIRPISITRSVYKDRRRDWTDKCPVCWEARPQGLSKCQQNGLVRMTLINIIYVISTFYESFLLVNLYSMTRSNRWNDMQITLFYTHSFFLSFEEVAFKPEEKADTEHVETYDGSSLEAKSYLLPSTLTYSTKQNRSLSDAQD